MSEPDGRQALRAVYTLPLVLIAFIAPYALGWSAPWWKFAPTTLGVVALWRWARPQRFRDDLGLRLTVRTAFVAVGALTAVIAAADHIIPGILTPLGYEAGPGSAHLGWKFALPVFQALNEEMLLRALPLTFLYRAFSHGRSLIVHAMVAAVFALLHFAFYRFGAQGILLSHTALLTLFFFGLAGNILFAATGSIAVPYAIHVAWNVVRFGSDWVRVGTHENLGEAHGFNLIEGNTTVLAFVLGLVAVVATAGCLPKMRPATAPCA